MRPIFRNGACRTLRDRIGGSRDGSGRAGAFPATVDFFVLFAIFLVANLAAGAAAVPLAGASMIPPAEGEPTVAFARTMTAVYVASMGLTLAGVWLYRRLRRAPRIEINLNIRQIGIVTLLHGILLMLAVGVVLEPFLELLPAREVRLGWNGWAIFSVAVAAPLLEEWLCRGILLQSVLLRRGPVAAWLLSALFFGVMHFDPLYVVNAAAMGLILGYVVLKSRTLWTPVALHALNNLSALWLDHAGLSRTTFSAWCGGGWRYGLLYAVAAGVVVLSAPLVWRAVRGEKGAKV